MTEQKTTFVQKDIISVQDLFYLCLNKWYWFIISLILCLGFAIFYLIKTQPIYTRTASILIKDENNDKKSSASAGLSSFSDFGLFSSNTNVNDEIGILQSPDLMRQVIKRLHLNTDYIVSAGFRKKNLYGKELPINVSFDNLPDDTNASFTLELDEDRNLHLTDFIKDGKPIGNDNTINGKMNIPLRTPLGLITITPSTSYNRNYSIIQVLHSALNDATDNFTKGLVVVQNDEKSSIITLSFKDVSVKRADDILNTLIQVYNENWIKDKNKMAISTSAFINNRLGVIESELGHVDNDISAYKSSNLLPNVDEAAKMYMTQANSAESSVKDLISQVFIARYMQNSLIHNKNVYQPLPTNAGIDNPALSAQISEYNNQLLERNSLASQSSSNNPLVSEMDVNLKGMRNALIRSINNQIVLFNEQIKSLNNYSNQAFSKIASNPKQAKYLLSVERQQKVKESLYLYLLQKREENELSQAFTAYNTRIITMPEGRMSPTAPVKKNIILIALAFGIFIPVLIIFISENINTEVRGRKDLENLDIPFVGEIPLADKGKKIITCNKRIKHERGLIVVQEANRNVINEAFRVLRTNLEFMLDNKSLSHIVMLTSANSGSGKTFITFNLAATLAIRGKRVLAIDLDLRKRSLSRYVENPKIGISHYLSGHSDTPSKVSYKISDKYSLDIIPVGIMPPNPTELLSSKKLQPMFEQLRKEYDYILIDCPPVEIVADADIINKYVDMTLFIIRAGLLNRSMLPNIEKYYKDHKYNNLSIILNGTDCKGSRYGYKYGYKYGYHYGYGY